MSKKYPFTSPKMVASVTGKLVVVGGLGSSHIAIRDEITNRAFFLNDRDTIIVDGKPMTVEHDYGGNDRLNDRLGRFINGPRNEYGQICNLFLWRVPAKDDDLTAILNAYHAEAVVTVKFNAKPLAEKTTCFVSGNLQYYYEQGMEQIMFSVHDREHSGYDALNLLEIGDFLTIYNAKGRRVVWQGRFTQKRRELLLESYYKRKKPSPVVKTLLQAFAQELPVLLKKAKKA